MKKFIALMLVTIGVATSARAQWVVYDPTLHTQSILNTAQEIAKYIEMINNQVQQIQTLTDQFNEFKHYGLRNPSSHRLRHRAGHCQSQ
jgi:conjugal transfer/entry exclusion protein